MYKTISLISFLIRQFLLPNPFINMFENAEFINLLFGGIFILLAYILTGSWYVSKKDYYFIGSIGFLLNYSLLTFLFLGLSYVISNITIVCIIFMIIYCILCIVERKVLGDKIIF